MRARLIIPVWGSKYVARLNQACLPALLAPGNLPHLAEHFECELVIVTQAELFEQVRSLPLVRRAQQISSLKLIAMDDVLSHPHYYGYTITHSLYRGFLDLGEAAKDTWCLFLNADFLLADGSYRALARRMLAGERMILAPSYCTIEENVWPAIRNRTRAAGETAMAFAPREMANLIIENRHYTIRSKTINCGMYRIDRVDQFYYVVDNDTILCRQIPIAVVAFRAERLPKAPITLWDYGIISEVCPNSPLSVIGDSDEFLMMELRGHRAMADQLQLGRLRREEIAQDLSLWTTKDQRACGEFGLVLHRGELPPDLARSESVLNDYYRSIMARVAPVPRDHREHYIWIGLVRLHSDWIEGRKALTPEGSATTGRPGAGPAAEAALQELRLLLSLLVAFLRELLFFAFAGGTKSSVQQRLYDLLRPIYVLTFGRLPEVGPLHPYYSDIRSVIDRIRTLSKETNRVLAAWSVTGVTIAPHLSRWFNSVQASDTDEVMNDGELATIVASGPFDLCFLELSRDDLMKFSAMHRRLRAAMKKGGKIIVFYRTRGLDHVQARDYALIENAFPQCDLAELYFRGGRLLYWLQRLWEEERPRVGRGGFLDYLRFAAIAALIAPCAALANWKSLKAVHDEVPRRCTSMCLEVTVM